MSRPAEFWVDKIAPLNLAPTTLGGGGLQRIAQAVLGIFVWIGQI